MYSLHPCLQSRYWRCLQRFTELWGFDPYATPFGAREAMDQLLSPPPPNPTPAESQMDNLASALMIQRGEMPPMPASPQVLSRALNRSKWSSQRQQVPPPPPGQCIRALSRALNRSKCFSQRQQVPSFAPPPPVRV